jgi:hypothetical protein
MMIDDIDFGFLLIVGMAVIVLGACVYAMLNSGRPGRDR